MEATTTIPSPPRRTNTSSKSPEAKWNILVFWFTFFMAFPAIVIVQNISVYIFGAILLFSLRYIKGPVLSFRKPAQWWALLFALGAVISVANIPPDAASNALERSLSVLPNYLYWSALVIFMITHRRIIKMDVVYKALFWGVSTSVIYYIFLEQHLTTIPIFITLAANGFAFLLVCFAPSAVHYVSKIKNKKWGLVYLLILVLVLLTEGRRAGMVLVFCGGICVLYADQLTWRRFFLAIIAIPLFILLIYSKPIESLVFQSNERIHEMIYQTENIQKEDRSYLDRVAMIKKGIAIFNRYPYTGIGLGNFTNYEIDFNKSFEGAQFVVNKANIQKKSTHNSYIGILAEGGIVHFAPFIIILLLPIVYFVVQHNSIHSNYKPVFWGFCMMVIHLYFIMAIVNVFAWFLIGLASNLIYLKIKN